MDRRKTARRFLALAVALCTLFLGSVAPAQAAGAQAPNPNVRIEASADTLPALKAYPIYKVKMGGAYSPADVAALFGVDLSELEYIPYEERAVYENDGFSMSFGNDASFRAVRDQDKETFQLPYQFRNYGEDPPILTELITDRSEHDFLSVEAAEQMARKVLEKLLPNGFDPAFETFALHLADINAVAEAHAEEERQAMRQHIEEEGEGLYRLEDIENMKARVYTTQDEGYLIFARFSSDGLPILANHYIDAESGRSVSSGGLYLFIDRQGVRLLETDQALYTAVETVANERPILSMEDVIDRFASFYEDMLDIKPLVVEQITFEYVPVPYDRNQRNAELRPLWGFHIRQELTYTDDDGLERTYHRMYWEYIDAYSGSVYAIH